MSDVGSSNWSETAANNNASAPNGWPEGMAPSGVNDSGRETHAALKRWYDRINGVKTTGGTANAQTCTYDVAEAAYYAGQRQMVKVGTGLDTTSTAPTLNINSLGATTLKDPTGSALLFGAALAAGAYQDMVYDGTDMRIMSLPWKSATFTPAFTVGGGSAGTSSATGTYMRLGPLVFFKLQLTFNAASSPTGALTITGLPYNAENGGGFEGTVQVSAEAFLWTTVAAAAIELYGVLTDGAKTIAVRMSNSSGGGFASCAPGLQNGTVLYAQGFYFTGDAF